MSKRDTERQPPGPAPMPAGGILPAVDESLQPASAGYLNAAFHPGGLVIDTLAATDMLRAAGFEDKPARAIVDLHRATGDALATKADIDDIKAELDALATSMKTALDAHRQEMKAELGHFATKTDLYREIGALRSEMRWMFGFQGALILAMAAKLFGIV